MNIRQMIFDAARTAIAAELRGAGLDLIQLANAMEFPEDYMQGQENTVVGPCTPTAVETGDFYVLPFQID